MNNTTSAPARPLNLQFRLTHLFYATAMIAAASAAMGLGGAIGGTILVAGWAFVFAQRNRPAALGRLIVFGMPLSLVCCCVLETGSQRRWHRVAYRDVACRHNLRQIGLALHLYYDLHGSLPPAVVCDGNGQPMHSWRVLLLPHLDQDSLYRAYNFNEPWNGPNNSRLAAQIPRVYQCPHHRLAGGSSNTTYLAVLGRDTAFPGPQPRKYWEILDGTANTVAVVESAEHAVNWLEPSDISYEEAIDLLSTIPKKTQHSPPGRHVLFADASCCYIDKVARETAAKLLAIDDGRPIHEREISSPHSRPTATPHWLSFYFVAILAILPLPWLWFGHEQRMAATTTAPESPGRARPSAENPDPRSDT